MIYMKSELKETAAKKVDSLNDLFCFYENMIKSLYGLIRFQAHATIYTRIW